jgi:hypothetical protein
LLDSKVLEHPEIELKRACSALAKETSLLTCGKKALLAFDKIMTSTSDVPRFG